MRTIIRIPVDNGWAPVGSYLHPYESIRMCSDRPQKSIPLTPFRCTHTIGSSLKARFCKGTLLSQRFRWYFLVGVIIAALHEPVNCQFK